MISTGFTDAFDGSATEKEQEEIANEVQEVRDLAAKAVATAESRIHDEQKKAEAAKREQQEREKELPAAQKLATTGIVENILLNAVTTDRRAHGAFMVGLEMDQEELQEQQELAAEQVIIKKKMSHVLHDIARTARSNRQVMFICSDPIRRREDDFTGVIKQDSATLKGDVYGRNDEVAGASDGEN